MSCFTFIQIVIPAHFYVKLQFASYVNKDVKNNFGESLYYVVKINVEIISLNF